MPKSGASQLINLIKTSSKELLHLCVATSSSDFNTPLSIQADNSNTNSNNNNINNINNNNNRKKNNGKLL